MSGGAFYNPDRVYMNIHASALASSVELVNNPQATYEGDRSLSIVGDVKLYKLSVVRCSVQGCRNFPLYIPNIIPGQPNPYLTTLSLSLKATWPGASAGIYTPATPSATKQVNYTIAIWDELGNVVQQATFLSSTAPLPPGTTAGDWATSIESTINAFGVKPGIGNTTVAATVGNQLVFTSSPNIPVGWSFGIAPNAPVPAAPDDACPVMGFTFGSTNTQFVRSPAATTPGTAVSLTLPYTCSYTYTPPVSGGGTHTSVQPLIWEKQTTDTPDPPAPIPYQDTNNLAYYMFDFAWFVYLINKTLLAAWNDILQTAATAGYTFPNTLPPTVAYVPSRQSFTLTVPSIYINLPTPTSPSLSLTMNEELLNLLAWPAKYLLSGTGTIIWSNQQQSVTPGLIYITSDYPATGSWSPVSSLVFLTSTLPTRPEVQSPPVFKGVGALPTVSSNDTAQVITDVIPAFSDAADWDAGLILYNPTVLRWVDLNDQTGGLNKLTFSIGWRAAVSGAIYPLTLNPTASFTVKLLLQRRDVPF